MSNHLRAFLFDPSHAGQSVIDSIFAQWDKGNAVCVINGNLPKSTLDSAILCVDPSEVTHFDGSIDKRKLAIVETPNLAVVSLTSGTTSNPKPVELSFQAMSSSANSLYRAADLDDSARWLCCLPPYYIAGLAVIARSWIKEVPVSFHNTFDLEKVSNEINSNSVDAISLIPNQLKQLLDANVDLSKLQTILVGGSSVDFNLQNTVLNLGLNVHFTYGLTETFGGICLDHKLFDNTEAEIVNGQIYLRSGSMMSGYRHDQRLTFHKLTHDGWFATGDLGTYENNILNVTGRIDDLINSGGIKIEPLLIEKAMQSIGYNQAIVVATPHNKLGQCLTVVFNNKSDISGIKKIRDELRPLLPSTHLPIRIAISNKFDGNTSAKINRKEVASDCEIISEYDLEKK